jgi:hypothetical protein
MLVVLASPVVMGPLAAPAPADAADAARHDPPRRDEFGLVPEEPRDEDLSLPDPVLDRTWSGPKPGEVRPAPGSDEPQGDADLPDVLDRDAPDLSELELGDEARPSTPRRGGDDPADDAGDPGDLEDSGEAGE